MTIDTQQELKITVERIFRLPSGENPIPLKAYVNICINDVVTIAGFRVIHSQISGKFFVTAPQEQGKDKRWYDIVRFKDQKVVNDLQEIVLAEYHKNNQ